MTSNKLGEVAASRLLIHLKLWWCTELQTLNLPP